jgi:hypothetical protein
LEYSILARYIEEGMRVLGHYFILQKTERGPSMSVATHSASLFIGESKNLEDGNKKEE